MVYRISAGINKLQPAWKYNTSLRLYFCVCLCMCVLYIQCMHVWACVWTCVCGYAHLSALLFTLTFVLFCFETSLTKATGVCHFDLASWPRICLSPLFHARVTGRCSTQLSYRARDLNSGPLVGSKPFTHWPIAPDVEIRGRYEWICTVWHRQGHAYYPNVPETMGVAKPSKGEVQKDGKDFPLV